MNAFVLIAAVVFSVATLWIPYSVDMWQQGHYQYFPLLLAGVAWLLWSRAAEMVQARTKPLKSVFLAGLCIVIAMALASQLLNSGFCGIVTSILALWVLTYGLMGWGGLKVAIAPLLLLVFAVPLPLELDKELIVKMQFLASSLASALLDGLHVLHFRQGVILVTEKSQFLTEEACSGIRSLFSSLGVVGVFSVMLRHHWPRAVFNLLQTVVWVILGNAFRLVAVVLLADNVSRYFAEGVGHEILGMLVFVFILGMVVSTDALARLLVYGEPGELMEETTHRRPTPDPGYNRGFDTITPKWRTGLLVSLCLVGIIGLRVAWVSGSAVDLAELANMPIIPAPIEGDLPTTLVGWERGEMQHVQRDVSALLAKDSFVWPLVRDDLSAVVSVDCPWAEWHNLAGCYLAQGWETESDFFKEIEIPEVPGGAFTASELRLKQAGRYGFVVFSVVDRNRQDLFPSWRNLTTRKWSTMPNAILHQIATSLGLGLQTQFAAMGRQLPATTIQILAQSDQPFTDQQHDDVRKLFASVRQELLSSQRWSGAQSPELQLTPVGFP